MDGLAIQDDPKLLNTAEADRTICVGEAQKAGLAGVTFSGGGAAGIAAQIDRNQAQGDVYKGCMAQRGYAIVPIEQREKALAHFRATNGQPVSTAALR